MLPYVDIQGWAQGHMRDSTLEYRLSIYHASSQDSGEYTCITPLNNSHSIQIQVLHTGEYTCITPLNNSHSI